MSKEITINGVNYIFYVRPGRLVRCKPSGLPNAGAICSDVKRGSAEFKRVIDALIAAGSVAA